MRTLNAHFDGRFIVLDEPARLKPNAKVKVIAADADEANGGLADDVFNQLADMAKDPQIQRELRSINAGFAAAESDGLAKI